MTDKGYQKALRFIYDRQHFGIKLGLDNIRRFSGRLGNPQDKYHTVHVAGTNGKGSTAGFIACILQQGGYRVGILTSPHLADYRERIRVNGKKITPGAIAEFIKEYRKPILDIGVTFFETTTALAFWYFAREKVDWAVLETGLGGRLDATNIVIPKVAVITNISLEHTNLLGQSIYKIAGEKGGIIKPDVPLVTGVINNGNDAARRIGEICSERNAPVHYHRPRCFGYSFSNRFDFLHIKNGAFSGLKAKVSLAGRHQVENAFLAVRAAEVIKSQGFHINKESVKRGLAKNYWPGRFMTVRKRPAVIIDVAHNREGFTALAETLRRRYPGRKFDFLVGMVEKKKGDICLKIISPLAHSISVAPLKTERSDDPYHLISHLDFRNTSIRVFPDAVAAAKDLLENSALSDILIMVGSHFLIGEMASLIKKDGF